MLPGTIVTIAGKETGVLVFPGETTCKVMVYSVRTGKWSSPMDYAANSVRPAPACDTTSKAQKNIRRHGGVIPYGGSITRWARVWPTGKEP